MFLKKEIKGEEVELKDGTKVKFVFELNELKKVSAKDLNVFDNSLVEEYTYNNQTKSKTLEETEKNKESIVKNVENNKNVFILVFNNNTIVGKFGLSMQRGRKDHSMGLGMMFSKEYRNKGLGQKTFNKGLELLKEFKNGIKFITLEVYESNVLGRALYNKLGFKEVAKIPDALQWQPPGQKQLEYKDSIVMHYYL
jgi:ribosomal protein S18 acetylase RimI-like enzyme